MFTRKKNGIIVSMILMSFMVFQSQVLFAWAEESASDSLAPIDGLQDNAVATNPDEVPTETLIVTGDVVIDSTIDNQTNTNVADLSCVDCTASNPDTASGTLDMLDENSASSSIEVLNENEATTTNDVVIEANTGENIIASGTKAVIKSGDISIISIVVNFINNNFFGKGQQFFVNIFDSIVGTLDFSGFAGAEPSGTCETIDCSLNIENNSTSTLANSIQLDADTGNNLIVDSETGYIETGDIDIVNDIVNVANLNVSGDGWFFAVVNIFGALDGDVILPSFKTGSNNLLADAVLTASDEVSSTSPETSNEIYIANSNMSDTLNEVIVNASSGENSASSSEGAVIETGDINLDIHTFNFVNYNITGDFWKFAKINIYGDWNGFIEGLPEGYSYMEDDFGITVYNDFLNNSLLTASYAKKTLENYNQASTTNEVEINANTGENTISGDGVSYIHTGDINVTSSLMNFINANFTGDNWEFSMINVFGSWQGNLAFGQGDLWITEAVSVDKINGGDNVTYTFLYGNNGDSQATDVRIVDDFDEDLMEVQGFSEGVLEDTGKIVWHLGAIAPNTQGSFSYTLKAKSNLPTGSYDVLNQAKIFGHENDRDNNNNIATAKVLLSVDAITTLGQTQSGFGGSANNVFPSLKVTKTNNKNGVAHPGEMVDYEILIKNIGTADLFDVLVEDVMTVIETGEAIKNGFWDLGTLYTGEEVVIKYTIQINSSAVSNNVINEVIAEGYDKNRGQYIHAVGSSKIRIEDKVFADLLSDRPDIAVALKTDNPFYTAGDIVEIELVITNNGGKTAKEVFIKSSLAEGLTFLEESDKVNNNWHFDWLNPGQVETIKTKVLVPGDLISSQYSLTAIVSGDNFEEKSSIVNFDVRDLNVLGYSEILEPKNNDSINLQGRQNENFLFEQNQENEAELEDDEDSTNAILSGADLNKSDLNYTEEDKIKTSIASPDLSVLQSFQAKQRQIPYSIQIFVYIFFFLFLLYVYFKVGDFYLSNK